jgi:hypothetical protein
MSRGAVALAIAIVSFVGFAVLSVIELGATGPDLADPASTLLFGAAVAAFAFMGALLIRRVPANPIGLLLLATAIVQTVGLGFLTYGGLGTSAASPWPGAAIASAFGDVWYTTPFVMALIGIPLLFPDGRLPSRRYRWVAWLAVVGMTLQGLVGLASLIPGSVGLESILGMLTAASVAAIVFGVVGAGVAIWARFRRGGPVQRQQVKWLLAVAGVAAVAFPAALVLGSSETPFAIAFWVIGFLAYLALPVAIGIAILRYHLYEIDRIISRTIAYATVTITMAVVFATAVLLLQSVLAPVTDGNAVAVAASTLLVAGLFQPLRRRVGAVVDRRFNRARYDAERTAMAFATRLRGEIELETVSAEVCAVVARTVAPVTVDLWIRQSTLRP